MVAKAMPHYRPNYWMMHPSNRRFIFATGIECSYPNVKINGRVRRIDQLEKAGHYEHWRADLELTREMGIRFLRYGPPYYRIHVGPGRYDWDFTDEVLPVMRDMGIIPILDLCHFGVPDWIENFQNPEFPHFFAEYACEFAKRYPWIMCYTPINEMYITAEFSAYFGWWNEQLSTHRSFVTALKHIVRASFKAMHAIIDVNPHALFILAESSENTHAHEPQLVDEALMFNERRFLSLDLTCGRLVDSGMYTYLRDNGMTEAEYLEFLGARLIEHIVIGHDYYATNERLLINEFERVSAGDIFGYYVLAQQYYRRYDLPVMHTETNIVDPHCVSWLWKTWENIQQLRRDGVPVCGMTWYSLVHQVDWDTAMREENNRVHPVGLFDLQRNITPVGREYKKLIDLWKLTPLLPNGPLTLAGALGRPVEGEQSTDAEGKCIQHLSGVQLHGEKMKLR